ncbi:MAG: hypothetical protein ABJP34_05430 [Erythrobacter sp.]
MASKAKKNGNYGFHEKRRNTDHSSFLTHKGFLWLWIAVILSGGSIYGYMTIEVEPRHNGGSWFGYTLGTIGALLILWLTMLGVRKRRMSAGHWSLKAWTSAHVYLGLALIVVGTLHTGFQFGWNVHTLAYGLMLFVIASGMYGITVYASLPRALSNNRHEMTRGEMVDALAAIDRQLESAAQPLARKDSDRVISALNADVFSAGFTTRLTGAYPLCSTSRALRNFSDASGDEARERVQSLLTSRKDQLGQIRRQMRLKALLEVWLFIHIPTTIALIAALTAHIISVFYYW